jgi:hypothetical protein
MKQKTTKQTRLVETDDYELVKTVAASLAEPVLPQRHCPRIERQRRQGWLDPRL